MKKNGNIKIFDYLVTTIFFVGTFLFTGALLAYLGDFFYAKTFGENSFEYKAALAQVDTGTFFGDLPEEKNDKSLFSYQIKDQNDLSLSAQAYLVSDLETGEVILSKNKDFPVPIASITKLMTALVSLETINPKEKIGISSIALATYGDSADFKAGDELNFETILYPLLLESSNDAAEALAEKIGRGEFLKTMNQRALELGMISTHFEDPSGLSPLNVSSAEDLLKLTDYIYHNQSFLLDITKLKKYQWGRFSWLNRNNLTEMEYYVGGKNGYTDEANRTLVSLFKLPLSEKGDRTVVLVLLGSENRQADTKKIIKYLFQSVVYR